MTKLIVFDFDSTLMDGECINIVLDQIIECDDKKRELEALRANGMKGEVSLQTSLEQRIAYFKGLPVSKLEVICQSLPWMPNAEATIAELKQRNFLTVCLSGAFHTATRRVINDLGMDAYCCNTLEAYNDKLTGRINGRLMHHLSKGELVEEIQNELHISKQNTIVVGDGANDLSMFEYAEKKIAFCATDVLNENANCIIQTKDLSEVLKFVD